MKKFLAIPLLILGVYKAQADVFHISKDVMPNDSSITWEQIDRRIDLYIPRDGSAYQSPVYRSGDEFVDKLGVRSQDLFDTCIWNDEYFAPIQSILPCGDLKNQAPIGTESENGTFTQSCEEVIDVEELLIPRAQEACADSEWVKISEEHPLHSKDKSEQWHSQCITYAEVPFPLTQSVSVYRDRDHDDFRQSRNEDTLEFFKSYTIPTCSQAVKNPPPIP